jgi:hypothetical protein
MGYNVLFSDRVEPPFRKDTGYALQFRSTRKLEEHKFSVEKNMAESFFETHFSFYQTTRRQTPDDSRPNLQSPPR